MKEGEASAAGWKRQEKDGSLGVRSEFAGAAKVAGRSSSWKLIDASESHCTSEMHHSKRRFSFGC